MAHSGSQEPGRSVISKAMAVLSAFSPVRPVLTLNELAGLTGLPLSTTYRLVSELVERKALERANGSGYHVGLKLWEIGSLAPSTATLPELAMPFMQDLYEATHENVQLAVLEGHEVLYLEKIRGRRSISAKTRRAGRLPLHATAAGKVLLAYAPAEFVDEVLTDGLKRYTPHTIVAPGHLRKALADVRRTGIAYNREELTTGILSVASPLVDAGGRTVAAMSLTVRSTGADLNRLAPAVRTAALCASRQLHLRPATPALPR
jgi:DNA-binding IclR family transcriptional regulator